MFRTVSGTIVLVSDTCPVRAGAYGRPHLKVQQANSEFLVQAFPDGESATVNGVDVWDLEKNNWGAYEDDDGSDCSWEEYAAEESAGDPAPVSQAVIDDTTAKLSELAERLDDLQAENTRLAEDNARQGEALTAADARIIALEDQVVDLEKALDEATQPEDAPAEQEASTD